MSVKPRVLVLGGLGFIGRHFVKYVVDNNLASKIRVADKTMVAMARLGSTFTPIFENSEVEFVQANLITPEGAAKAFTDPTGDYDVVVNLAAETKLSQSDSVYAEGITKLSVSCILESKKHNTQKFICVSTAEVYEPSKKPANESSSLKPWTGIGRAKAEAEKAAKTTNANYILLRPGVVYGPGDTTGLAPRLCFAAVYKKTGEKLEYPNWFEDCKIHTVHVTDVARAIWHVSLNGKPGDIYNLADKNDTDQKKLNVITEKLFGIQTGHLGMLKSEAVKLMKTENLLEEINGEIIPTWVKMTSEAKLNYTPLSPYLNTEAIANKHLSIDGSAIEATGFKYNHPNVGEAEIREQLADAVKEGWFPSGLFN